MGELGYIRDKLDVKYLILFVMSCLDIQVTFDDVAEMAMIDNAMTYFDVSDAFYEMVESGHVAADGNYYSITERGRQVLTGYERRLPASVRRDAQKAVMKTVARLKRDAMISTSTKEVGPDNFVVTLKMSDSVGELISLDMMVVNKRLALLLEGNFKANAEVIYNEILNAVMRDYSQTVQPTAEPERPADDR
ncbi:MAG: DUF4364 family protein [Ruminococcaceae bacterium]|nr:DUF4364 family protein [Oscillospiraceae bacterium]